jgi:hypothetical protein
MHLSDDIAATNKLSGNVKLGDSGPISVCATNMRQSRAYFYSVYLRVLLDAFPNFRILKDIDGIKIHAFDKKRQHLP